ncbi:MAG: class I SAM-dependent methyltransferase [Anaerolineae bacterium]|nr:class I SAM-dependent methyltransferase [Anaerolineae bacterium]
MFKAIMERRRETNTWQKIPWNEPEFSKRMLKEHLTQAHDAASRRTAIIERQVAWIHEEVLGARPSRVLDLGCGPGLYASRLAALGHQCVGIDFSPASIDYARQQRSDVTYIQADVREADFGTGFDLAMMLYGEINTFTPTDAQCIIDKALAALKPGGALLLEPHPYEAVKRIGSSAPSWYSAEEGLLSPRPFVCLEESFFQDGRSMNRFYVIDAETGSLTTYGSMTQAYTEAEYRQLLRAFATVTIYPSLVNPENDGMLCAIVARKA